MEVPILRFLLELVPSLLIGFWAGRRHQTLSTRLAAPLVRFGVPVSVMGLLLKGGLSGDMLQAAGLAVLAMSLVWWEPLACLDWLSLCLPRCGLAAAPETRPISEFLSLWPFCPARLCPSSLVMTWGRP